MPKDEKQPQREQIKVTDKRIFTSDGEIREEFRDQVTPSEPRPATPPAQEPPRQAERREAKPAESAGDANHAAGPHRRRMGDRGANPGTPFTNFIEPLIAQAYMSLGMLPNPYAPQQGKADVGAARQMIDILTLLQQKTAGNLTPEEEEFLGSFLGELKLAFVKITKTI